MVGVWVGVAVGIGVEVNVGVIVAVAVGVDVGVCVDVNVAVGVNVGGTWVSVGSTAVLVGGGVGEADCNWRAEEQPVITIKISIATLILINDSLCFKSLAPKTFNY
ncbi:unnamed protein product [marine sediment metagenome]|uniref:Uncharacterized protein n=1 Tax=marine sediment metagenome TaxID=412755 RepID=X1F735_9ZZZZ